MSITNEILAGAPGEHCVTGVRHSGEPKGVVEKIAGVDTYVSLPPHGQKLNTVILFYADVWGPLFINNKLLQDYFAAQGFVVVGIDYFDGDPIYLHANEEGFDRPAWFSRMQTKSRQLEPRWFDAIKGRYPNAKFCAVGYCFGAPFVCEAGASGKVVVGAVGHPAFLNEEHFENITALLFLSCAETDHTFQLSSRRRAEDILVEGKKTYHFQVFSGVKHGFALRGDPSIENERWAKEESARSIAGWFKRFVGV